MDCLVCHHYDAPLLKRVLATMSTGWLSAVLSNPTDVVKIRMISDGAKQRYSGVIAAFRDIVHQEGTAALGKGLSVRAQVCSCVGGCLRTVASALMP